MKLDGKTNAELIVLMEEICNHPENRNPNGGVFLYKPTARRKLDEIARQITHNNAMARAARGDPVRADGYSGRTQNRR